MARPKRLFWYLLLPLLAAVISTAAAVSWFAASSLRSAAEDAEALDLEAAARLAVFHVLEFFPGDASALRRICQEMGTESDRRVTLALPDGTAACDSETLPDWHDPAHLPPELASALGGHVGTVVRHSAASGPEYLYVAVPLRRAGVVAAALRLGIPYATIEEHLRTIRLRLFAVAAMISAAGALLSYLFARWLSRPIEQLRVSVDRFAAGDLAASLPAPHTLEVAALRDALAAMAGQLHARIEAVEAQRRLQGATLRGLAEGVIAADADGRLLLVNRAAEALLGRGDAGALLREIPGAEPLAAFAVRASEADDPIECEIQTGPEGSVRLHLWGTALRGGDGSRIGALLVLNDISRLERLERARRDFVGNISHELKTPITTISGYVELLLGGALDDRAAAERFLETIRRQSERMNLIFNDLLVLSQLEDRMGTLGSVLEPVEVADLIGDALEATRGRAEEATVRVDADIPEGLRVRVGPLLLSQAVANLLRNAIAHTEPGGRVRVCASAGGGTVTITVLDWGDGIAPEHLHRVFERFYRVDAGRSRQLGGSGLGLAIVKHIALAHGGSVSVASAVGEGSAFTITLPAC